MPRHDRNHDPGEHSTGDDLEQYVRERVRRVVDIAQAGVAHRLGKHQPASESKGPGNQCDSGHAQGDCAETCIHPRPRWSSQRSAGVRSMIAVKLTRSLARLSATTASRTPSFAGRGSQAAATVPTAAPSAFAPQSPSMDLSRRSLGRHPAAAPRTGAAPTPTSPAASASVTLAARPGRRSQRLVKFAVPAISTVSISRSARRIVTPAPDVRPRSRLAAAALSPTPAIFTAPLVRVPDRSAARCPLKPFAWLVPRRSSYAPTAPDPVAASATAPRTVAEPPGTGPGTSRPASIARMATGPSASVTSAPAWLRRVHLEPEDTRSSASRLPRSADEAAASPDATAHPTRPITGPEGSAAARRPWIARRSGPVAQAAVPGRRAP